MAWRRYRLLWLAYRIERRVNGYTADQPQKAVAFYLSAIEDLLKLAGFKNPPGYTIESYLLHIASIGKTPCDPVLSAAFNRIYYNGEAGEQEIMQKYKQLFQSLYKSGFRDLQAIAAAGRN